MRGNIWDGLYGISLLFQALLRFMIFIYASESLGIDEYGNWPVIVAFAGYSVIMGRGSLPYLAIELPILHGRGELDKLFSIFMFARRKIILDWGLAFLVSILFFYSENNNFISFGILIAIAWSAYQLQVKLFRALDQMKTLFISVVIGASVFFFVGMYSIRTSIDELFFSYFLSIVAQTAFLYWQERKLQILNGKKIGIGYKRIDGNLAYMGTVLFFSILSTFDRWLAKLALNNGLELYSIVVFSMMIGFLLLTIISQIFEPKIYRLYFKGSPVRILSIYGGLLSMLFLAGLGVIYIVLYQLNVPFIENIYYVKAEFITNFFLFLFIIPGVVFTSALKANKMITSINWNIILSIFIGVSCFLCALLLEMDEKGIVLIQTSIFSSYLSFSILNYLSYRKLPA